jgi:hypothetical protein
MAQRSLLVFVASLLSAALLAAPIQDKDIKVPKITATVELPALPDKNDTGSVGPFSTGPVVKPVVVDEDTKKKLEELAKTYAQVAKDNYPLIVKTLQSKGKAHDEVHIVVTYRYNGVAATSGAGFGNRPSVPTIQVSAKYALAHPDDLGMIVHEMVHVVQSYASYDPVWLVEGIADYVRWFFYEPQDKRPHPNPAKATARDSYRTTGAFLFWASGKYNPDLVVKLHAAYQANNYKESMFKDLTGKTLDELNTEWIASLKGEG